MRDARHPRSRGVDSVCGKRPEQPDPQGQREGQWWSGAGEGMGVGVPRARLPSGVRRMFRNQTEAVVCSPLFRSRMVLSRTL